jgi:hypothetical protein
MTTDNEMRNQAVALPVVVPFRAIEKGDKPDGVVFLQKGRLTNSVPVTTFIKQGTRGSLRYAALCALISASKGLRSFDPQLIKNLRPLFHSTFEEKVTDAILETLRAAPMEFVNQWFSPLWNEAMKSAHVVLVWWNWPRGPQSAALYCPGPEDIPWSDPERIRRARNTALFVTSSLDSDITAGRVRVCPGCGDWFKPQRTNQQYHDSNCAARHRNERKRERDKQLRGKTAKKGKSHGEN